MKTTSQAGTLSTRMKTPGYLVLPAVVFLALPAPANAQTASAEDAEQEIKLPRIGGHTFIPTERVPNPFIRTFLRNAVGIGKALDIDFPLIEIDTVEVLGLKGDLIFANLDFEYQQAITSWLAVRGQFRITGRLGNGVQALLAQGITAATGFEFGWLFKLFTNDRMMLSGNLDLANRDFTAINIERFVDDIINGNPASLIRNTPSTRGGGGLRFAWAISPAVGLTATAGTGYGESVNRHSDSEWYYDGGIAVDVDLGVLTVVPIGFVLSYDLDSFPEGGEDITGNVQTIGLSIAYTGQPQFSFSIDMFGTLTPLRGQSGSKTTGTTINLRYFF